MKVTHKNLSFKRQLLKFCPQREFKLKKWILKKQKRLKVIAQGLRESTILMSSSLIIWLTSLCSNRRPNNTNKSNKKDLVIIRLNTPRHKPPQQDKTIISKETTNRVWMCVHTNFHLLENVPRAQGQSDFWGVTSSTRVKLIVKTLVKTWASTNNLTSSAHLILKKMLIRPTLRGPRIEHLPDQTQRVVNGLGCNTWLS